MITFRGLNFAFAQLLIRSGRLPAAFATGPAASAPALPAMQSAAKATVSPTVLLAPRTPTSSFRVRGPRYYRCRRPTAPAQLVRSSRAGEALAREAHV